MAIGGGWSAFENGASFLGFGGGDALENAATWRRFAFRWENTFSQIAADDVFFTVDLANITNGQLDGTWTDEDYDLVWSALAAIAAGVAPFTASHLTCTTINAYVMGFNDYANPKPFIESGPPEHVYQLTQPGAMAQPAGAVVCTTLTEMTPLRSHWGRFYSPSIGANALTGGGRLANAYVTSLANAVGTAYSNLMSAQFWPVVPTTQADKLPMRTLQGVTAVRVDDVPDTQRSRRPKYSNLRVTVPVEAATQPAGEISTSDS